MSTPPTQKTTIERFFEPCVLYLLTLHPSYGYELKQNLEEKCHCTVDMGNLYRALKKLEGNGYVKHTKETSSKGPLRNRYSITVQGKNYLQTWITELTEQQRIITKLISHYQHTVT